jgi:hypothetical protein
MQEPEASSTTTIQQNITGQEQQRGFDGQSEAATRKWCTHCHGAGSLRHTVLFGHERFGKAIVGAPWSARNSDASSASSPFLVFRRCRVFAMRALRRMSPFVLAFMKRIPRSRPLQISLRDGSCSSAMLPTQCVEYKCAEHSMHLFYGQKDAWELIFPSLFVPASCQKVRSRAKNQENMSWM